MIGSTCLLLQAAVTVLILLIQAGLPGLEWAEGQWDSCWSGLLLLVVPLLEDDAGDKVGLSGCGATRYVGARCIGQLWGWAHVGQSGKGSPGCLLGVGAFNKMGPLQVGQWVGGSSHMSGGA